MKIEIRFWETCGSVPTEPEDMVEHVKKVAHDLENGCTSGEIIGDGFAGWWDIRND